MLSLELIDKIVPSEVKLLAKWRKAVQPLWHETFKVTISGTTKWLQGVIDNSDKALFFVIKNGKKIGHVGFNIIDGDFYIDNIIRGTGKSDGSMTKAVQELIRLNIYPNIYLLVYPDNKHAIKFYEKIGFVSYRMSDKYLKMRYENNC